MTLHEKNEVLQQQWLYKGSDTLEPPSPDPTSQAQNLGFTLKNEPSKSDQCLRQGNEVKTSSLPVITNSGQI
jgi:hypothetical protein